MKYLIVGLGNIGDEYAMTRHNIGFMILDAFAKASNITFTPERYGDVARMRLKNAQLILLKPSTYMNLSGNAVRYWRDREKIDNDHLLVVVDDIALPFGAIRLKANGSEAGLSASAVRDRQRLPARTADRIRARGFHARSAAAAAYAY